VSIEKLQQAYGLRVKWCAFPLHPNVSEEGLALEELFRGTTIDVKKAAERLKQVASQLGLPLSERTKTYNTRLAQEMAKWAEEKGKGDDWHRAVFRAYFVDAKNIGKADAVIEVATTLGLPAEEAKRVLDSRRYRSAVDADWSRAGALGITAVPTFILNQGRVTGAQPYDALEKFVKANMVKHE
jgi:predicted DsbA family dithiol-disulfide isomerase